MQDKLVSYPLTGLTPMEMRELTEKSRQTPLVDPMVEEMMGAPFGKFSIQARNSMTGALGWVLGEGVADTFMDDYSDGVNLTKPKGEFSPLNDPMTWGMDNNPEGIARLLEGVQQDELPYILTAPTWGEFNDRLRFVKAGMPEAQEAAGFGAGNVLGVAADFAGFAAIGAAAEPLYLAGLGARGLGARAAASSFGTYRTTELATAVSEAAASVSRLNLTARATAYGIAEAAMWQGVRNGIDPNYDPDASDIVWDMTFSGGLMGVLGGAVMGRRFLADHIEDAAHGFYATKTVDLPGGYQIKYTPGFAFDSPAAADQMLFARGTGSLGDEADRVAGELWEDWSKPGRRTDFSIPGQAATTRSAIKAAAFELSLAGVELSPQVFATVARILVNTESQKLIAGAFNKEFWEGIAREFPTVALRPATERAFIGNIDTTVRDLAQREDMVDSVYDYFRWNKDLAPDAPRSLIFQVLREIKDRGGRVDRQTVADVIDELRVISQVPPKRTNARGAQRIDYNTRRAAVIDVINRRAQSDREIFMPPSLVRNMTPGPAVDTASRLGRWTGTVGTDGQFRDVPRVQHWHDRLPGWNRLGNRSAFLHESENGALRLAAFMGSDARRSMDVAQPLTFKESALQMLHSTLFSFLKGYRNGFVKFAAGGGTENVTRSLTMADSLKANFRSRDARRAFHQRVAAQIESGAMNDSVEAVNETARSIKDILKRTYDMAQKAGLKGFTGPGIDNYFPWLWRFDRIRRLSTTEAGKADLVRLVRESFGDGRVVVIDGVEETFTGDLDEAAKVFAERLISIANRTENAPMLAQDQELFDALRALEGPLKTNQGSRSPFGRSRINVNRQAGISGSADHLNIGSNRLTMADLRNDDLPYVMKRYLTSVIGAISEKRFFDGINEQFRARGVLGPQYRARSGELLNQTTDVENLGQLKGLINKLGPTMSAAEEGALDSVVGALRLAPAQGQQRIGIGDKITSLVTSYGYLTTGGQFGLSAASETARIIGTVGLRAAFTQMPIINEMMTNWRNLDTPARNFVSFIDAHFAPATGRMMRVFKDELSMPMEAGGKVQRALDTLANVYSDVSGLAPITSFTQQLATAGIIQHLYDVGKFGVKRLDNATVRALGLEPEQYERVVQFVTRNAQVRDGFMGPRVVDLDNIDAIEFDDLKAFVQRFVESRIQSVPTRGDFHDSMFSFWGRLLLQFKTFNLKGIDNFLIQNSSRVARGSGIKVSQEIVATGVLAGLIHYGRNYADWWSYKQSGDRKRAEQAEKNLTVAGALRGVVMGPSEFFLLTQAGDAISTNFIDPDPIFSPYRYSGLKWYGFPAEAMVTRAASVARDVWGATAGKALGLPAERDITQGTAHRIRLMSLGQNFPGFKQVLNIGEQAVVDYYNLQRTQPRDRD